VDNTHWRVPMQNYLRNTYSFQTLVTLFALAVSPSHGKCNTEYPCPEQSSKPRSLYSRGVCIRWHDNNSRPVITLFPVLPVLISLPFLYLKTSTYCETPAFLPVIGKLSAGIRSRGDFTGKSLVHNVKAACSWSCASSPSVSRNGKMLQYTVGLIKQY
jgi:hypothetical protein